MIDEGQALDRKSIRYVLNKKKDVSALAADCVGFANAGGGMIQLGIEDGEDLPPGGQTVDAGLAEQLRKRISQVTVNVAVITSVETASNGGQYIEIRVDGNQQSVASSSDGRFFIRVSDETQPLRGDDLTRLMADRGSFLWELDLIRHLPIECRDFEKAQAFCEHVRASDRVSEFVKQKSDIELLEHYFMVRGGMLTQLGVLWIGRREDRAALPYAPSLQCIKYDERGRKVRKHAWDDYTLNPMEMLSAVWADVPEWRESYEMPAGLFRTTVPHYEEVVVRELLANALVHRPYTQRGDVFVNLHPDRMEVHNPGLLPVGVTPRNILHVVSQRNPHLAKVFYDLQLMEREGSGYDRMYEALLTTARPVPEVKEGDDRVVVTVRKQMLKPEIVDFMAKVDQTFQPTQRELICLGLVAQHGAVTALDLERKLGLRNAEELKHWLGHLRRWGLVSTRGKTKGLEYFVEPAVLRKLEFKGSTTLRGIEKHRLQELILQDLSIYRKGAIREIHERIGPEIARRKVQRALADLVIDGKLEAEGVGRGRRYLFVPKASESGGGGTKERKRSEEDEM
ncbi:MAG: ATP-binding protein [Planctomycetota bacterium]